MCWFTCFPLLHFAAQPPVTQSIGSIISALVPCLRLYAYLGCQLAKANPDPEHQYGGEALFSWPRNELVRIVLLFQDLLCVVGSRWGPLDSGHCYLRRVGEWCVQPLLKLPGLLLVFHL